jgi:hypothetical protein
MVLLRGSQHTLFAWLIENYTHKLITGIILSSLMINLLDSLK